MFYLLNIQNQWKERTNHTYVGCHLSRSRQTALNPEGDTNVPGYVSFKDRICRYRSTDCVETAACQPSTHGETGNEVCFVYTVGILKGVRNEYPSMPSAKSTFSVVFPIDCILLLTTFKFNCILKTQYKRQTICRTRMHDFYCFKLFLNGIVLLN